MVKKIATILLALFTIGILSTTAVFAGDDARCAGLVPGDANYALYKCTGSNSGTATPCDNLVPGSDAYKANHCIGNNVGTPPNPAFDLKIHINNPLQATTIQDAVKLFMGIILKLAIPVIVLFFLWCGISYILALGNAEKIKKVHNMFMYTVIGTLLILGAWTITNAIVGTINAVIAP